MKKIMGLLLFVFISSVQIFASGNLGEMKGYLEREKLELGYDADIEDSLEVSDVERAQEILLLIRRGVIPSPEGREDWNELCDQVYVASGTEPSSSFTSMSYEHMSLVFIFIILNGADTDNFLDSDVNFSAAKWPNWYQFLPKDILDTARNILEDNARENLGYLTD